MIPPRISIIMPCFNPGLRLRESVASVLAQSLPDWELILVDDGSTDGAIATLDALADPRVRILTQPNAGVSAARNRGLKAAGASRVAFLDADDTWAPEFLACMNAALDDAPQAAVAYCGWQNLGLPGGRGEPFIPPDYEHPEKERLLFEGCRWPIHAALSLTSALRAAGGFDTDLRNAEDYLLWLAVCRAAPVLRVPQVLAYYHFHDGEQASRHHARAAMQFLSAQRRHLARHPEFARRMGRARVREMTLGTLRARGFERYWARDLAAARPLFRRLLREGYISLRDLRYLLPALLPAGLQRRLLAARDR